jgi:TolA-binding protein
VNVVTKIFIVLVSLLAVLLVPLVAVNASNGAALKKRIIDLKGQVTEASAMTDAESASRQRAEAELQQQIRDLEVHRDQVQQSNTTLQGTIANRERELNGYDSRMASFEASLKVLTETDRSKAQLAEALVGELREVRDRAISSERRIVDLQEYLGDVENQLEVADAARRQLQEQVVRLSEDKDHAVGTIAKYVAFVGELPEARAGATSGGARVPADRDLSATVIAVRRSADGTLAEINAGTRDGVTDGWVLAITDGSRFVGNLRIIETDINRATGVIELEDVAARGEVKPGMRAIARKGD